MKSNMKSKYKIGQMVWYMSGNMACEDIVSGIFATANGIYYFLGEMSHIFEIGTPYSYEAEARIFSNKADLLKSL